MPDLSGNDLDATLDYTGDAPAWGHTSPIETDPSSREFWGWSNAGIFGFGGHSFISRVSDSLMTPSPKDFTVEEWLRPMDNIPTASDFSMVAKQNTGGTLQTDVGGTRIGGYCFDSAGTLFKVTDQSFVTTDHIGESFHVVVVRSGDALALYVNGTLRNFTTVESGLPTRFNSSPFYVHPDTLFYTNARHDEVAYYNYALGADRILAHYEAALNDATARGQCDIRTTAIISAQGEPDAIEYPFRHNWEQPVVERLSWRSSVFRPTDGSYEQRKQRTAPRRQIEYQHLAYNEELRRKFEARSFGGRTQLVQFEPDKVQVDALLTGATTATVDTRYRDFEVGQYVLVYQDDDTYEYQLLTAVTDTAIEWADGLSRDYTRPWLKPAREARLPLSQSLELQTDTISDAGVQYDLLEQDEPLSPRRIVPFASTQTYRSRELWDVRAWVGHNWDELPKLEYTSDRSLTDSTQGAIFAKTYQRGAAMAQSWNMPLKGRELIARYFGWLYERAGQANPFWMPTFRQDLKPVSAAGSTLTVAGHEYTNLYAPSPLRQDLAFVYHDGSVIGRQILSSSVDGSNDALVLGSAVPTFTNLRWLSFLRRVVLTSDELEIAWQTDNVIVAAFAVTDAPLDFTLGSPSMSPSPSPSLSHSLSPSPSQSASRSPSGSASPSSSTSSSISPSASVSPSHSASPST